MQALQWSPAIILVAIYMRIMSTMSNMCEMHMSTMANHVCHPQIFSLTLVLPEHRAGQPPQEFQLSAELLSISLVCQQRWNSLECFDGTYGWDGLLTMQLQYAICNMHRFFNLFCALILMNWIC